MWMPNKLHYRDLSLYLKKKIQNEINLRLKDGQCKIRTFSMLNYNLTHGLHFCSALQLVHVTVLQWIPDLKPQ
jgi:hypothetical protein